MKYRFASCELDTERRELRLDGEIRPIEPKVFSLLAFLIENRHRVVSKDDMIEVVWNGRIVSDAALSSAISAARSAVGDDGKAQALIRTVARRGFRFVAEIESGGAPDHGAEGGDGLPTRSLGARDVVEGRPVPLLHKPTLAVLPFENMSDAQDQEYLANGITEDIITALSRNRWLLVLSRNATVSFRDHGQSPEQIAKELHADYLVDGSVRRAHDRIRITVQLIDGSSGGNVWAEKYDRSINDVFELQDEITETVAARLEPELAAAERHRARHKPPQNLDAWDHYLLGLAQFYTFEKAGNEKAQALFRKAIELDPEFAQAYARLAYSLVLGMVYFDTEPSGSILDEALDTARKALGLDDQDAVAYYTLGRVHLARGEYQQAIRELETSLQLNPCLAVTYCGLGDALTYSGRLDDAIAQFENAIKLSPHDPYRWGFYSYRALAHLFSGDYEAAVEWAERAVQTPNAQYWSHAHLAAALGYLDRPEETESAVDELLKRKPDFSCTFAANHLFYIKDERQIDTYVSGLRRAGVPE